VKIKAFAIERFAAFLLSGRIFAAVRAIVTHVDDPALTGSEKRSKAIELIQQLGYGLAGWLINLAIELAVAWAKENSRT
jgi:hypothetical protein